MPKMTAKYSSAIKTAHNARLNGVSKTRNRDELYQLLLDHGYFWNSQSKKWEYHDIAQANPPTPLVMVRVWANLETVETLANALSEAIQAIDGWQCIQESKVYPCRPPKQKEGRVYLQFLPNQEENHAS